MKYYNFTVKMECFSRGYVEADSFEEAKQKILDCEYDDLTDMMDYEILEIMDIEESEE